MGIHTCNVCLYRSEHLQGQETGQDAVRKGQRRLLQVLSDLRGSVLHHNGFVL